MKTYGNNWVVSKGTIEVSVEVEGVSALISFYVVEDIQDASVLIGQNFTELPHIVVVEDSKSLHSSLNKNFIVMSESGLKDLIPDERHSTKQQKVAVRVQDHTAIPPSHVGHVKVVVPNYEGDLFIESSVWPQEGQEYCVPRVILTVHKDDNVVCVPVINLSGNELRFKRGRVLTRAWSCIEETTGETSESVCRIDREQLSEIPPLRIKITGSVRQHATQASTVDQ